MRTTIAAALLLTLAGAACRKDAPSNSTPEAAPDASTVAASPVVATRPATRPSAAQPPKTMEVTLWYVVSGARRFYLAPENHTIPYTPAIAKAALEELIHGKPQDPDHTVAYSPASTIRSVSIANRIATVDWSADVLRGHTAGSEVEWLSIQQVVWTLAEFPTIAKVRFTVEGKTQGTASNGADIESWWGHAGLYDQPFTHSDYIDDAEPIVLWSPSESSRSSGKITIRGEVVAPDGSHRDTVRILLRDTGGREVVSTIASVTYVDPYGSQPWRTTFAKTIAYTPPSSPQTWTVRVAIHNLHDDGVEFAETRQIRVE